MDKINSDNSLGALNHEVSLDNVIINAKKRDKIIKYPSTNGIFPQFEKAYDLIDSAITISNSRYKSDYIRGM